MQVTPLTPSNRAGQDDAFFFKTKKTLKIVCLFFIAVNKWWFYSKAESVEAIYLFALRVSCREFFSRSRY